MPAHVSDARSNKHEQIAHAAEILKGAPNRLAAFEAIYAGKKAVKTRSDIERYTGLDNKQVLNAAKKLVDNQLVSQEQKDGETAYRKDSFFAAHKTKILALACDPAKLARQPRSAHAPAATTVVRLTVSSTIPPPVQITVDDIDSFSRVAAVREPQPARVSISEVGFKEGIKRVVGEAGHFKGGCPEFRGTSVAAR